ncbi:HIT family protein [Undibacterium arcticum]
MTNQITCELCTELGAEIIYQGKEWHVVMVDDVHYPGFCRVIWNDHVKEMTDLTPAQRNSLMDAVWQVEQAVREVMQPAKINLATLGNKVPHLHWHVIPRFSDDAHFPLPIWAEPKRLATPAMLASRQALLPALRKNIAQRFCGLNRQSPSNFQEQSTWPDRNRHRRGRAPPN